MSNIYIQEPPTNGKILLKTSVGDIDIELWSREAPKAVRNFVQLCADGYYNGTIFHRVVKDFIVQGGDPTGSGLGGESIYGEPFKDEFHQRLRFVRRGLVAMANAGKDDNGSQFFFTLGQCQELQNKHTIFGKVTGDTLYNMIKLGDAIVDQNERPLYPQKIISSEILSNPFPDIVPRVLKSKSTTKAKEKPKEKGSKNFNLLSFGDEAEEEEEEVTKAANALRGKGKSSHDLLKNDPKLSSVPAVDKSELNDDDDDDSDSDHYEKSKKSDKIDRIKEKFKKNRDNDEVDNAKDDDIFMDEREEKLKHEREKLSCVRNEFKMLKKQMLSELRKKDFKPIVMKVHDNPAVAEFMEEASKYKKASEKLPPKGVSREEQALQLLEKFRLRLLSSKCERSESESDDLPKGDKDDRWLCHELRCQKEDDGPTLAKDANMRNEEDWYDIHDPRNPINKRRREACLVTGDKKPRTN